MPNHHQSGEQRPYQRPNPYRQGRREERPPPIQFGQYQQQHPSQGRPPAQQWEDRRTRRQQQYWHEQQESHQYQQHYEQPYQHDQQQYQQPHQPGQPRLQGPQRYPQQHDQRQQEQYQQPYHQPEQPRLQGPQRHPQQHDQHQKPYHQPEQPRLHGPQRHPQQHDQHQQPYHQPEQRRLHGPQRHPQHQQPYHQPEQPRLQGPLRYPRQHDQRQQRQYQLPHHQPEQPRQRGPQQHDQLQEYQQFHHQPEQPQQHEPQLYQRQYDQRQQRQYQQPKQPQQYGTQRYQQQPEQLQQQHGPHRVSQQQGQQQYHREPQPHNWRQKSFDKKVRPRSGTAVYKTKTVKLDADTIKRNKEIKSEGAKLPIRVLKQALGHVISMETVNGYIVKGKLTDIQVSNMNCELSQWLDKNNTICSVTSSKSPKEIVKMYDVLFVRGSTVRYWILPDVLISYATTLITEFIMKKQEIRNTIAVKKGKTTGANNAKQILMPLSPIAISDKDEKEIMKIDIPSDWFSIERKSTQKDKQVQLPTEAPKSKTSTKSCHPSREESQLRPGRSTLAPIDTSQHPIEVITTAPVEKHYPYYFTAAAHPVPVKRKSMDASSNIQEYRRRKSIQKESDWDSIHQGTSEQGQTSRIASYKSSHSSREDAQVIQPQPGGSTLTPMIQQHATYPAYPMYVPPQQPIEVITTPPVERQSYYPYHDYHPPVSMIQQSTEPASNKIPVVTGQGVHMMMSHPEQIQPVYLGTQLPYLTVVCPDPVEGQLLYTPQGEIVQARYYPQCLAQVEPHHPIQFQQPYPMIPYTGPQCLMQPYPDQVLMEASYLYHHGLFQRGIDKVFELRGKFIKTTRVDGTTFYSPTDQIGLRVEPTSVTDQMDQPTVSDQGPVLEESPQVVALTDQMGQPTASDQGPVLEESLQVVALTDQMGQPTASDQGPVLEESPQVVALTDQMGQPTASDQGPVLQESPQVAAITDQMGQPTASDQGPVLQESPQAAALTDQMGQPTASDQGPVLQESLQVAAITDQMGQPTASDQGPVLQESPQAAALTDQMGQPTASDQGPVLQESPQVAAITDQMGQPTASDQGPVLQESPKVAAITDQMGQPTASDQGPVLQESPQAVAVTDQIDQPTAADQGPVP